MTIMIPILFAFILGALIFGQINQRNPFKDPIDTITALWLGIGACSLSTFYSFILLNRYSPWIIIVIPFILILVLLFTCPCKLPTSINLRNNKGTIIAWLIFLVLAIPAWLIMSILSKHNSQGNWDAWYFWNYLARYLILDGSHFHDLYFYGNLAKHPWFLPTWTVFGWTLTGQSNTLPLLNSEFFAILVMATVFFGLRQLLNQTLTAMIATLWLISVPVFLSHSISQYADVILAGFIAINCLLLLRFKQVATNADAITWGLMLGLMTFVKDEGIICAFFIFILSIPLLPRSKRFYINLISSFSIIYIATVIIKYWVVSSVQIPTTLHFHYLFIKERYLILLTHFKDLLTQPEWGNILILPALLILSQFLRRLNTNNLILCRFLFLYLLSYLVFSLMRNNLPAYLTDSAYRLFYQLLPIAVILLFYALFNKEPKTSIDK